MSQVLITGANGFIGSHLVEALLKQGHEVRCAVRRTSQLQWLPLPQITLCLTDLMTGEGLPAALAGVDKVFHLAGATKAKNRAAFQQANVASTRTLLNALRQHAPQVRRFIFLSSQAAAGPSQPETPRVENDPCAPLTYYGESKRAAELLLAQYPDIPTVILRAVSVYGPRDRDFLTLVKSIKMGIAPIIGSRNKHLTFVHVEDVVQALQLAADHPAAVGKTYFITDGHIYTWPETKKTIEQVLGRKAWELHLPSSLIWMLAALSDGWARLWGKTTIFNLNRVRELMHDHWACTSERIQKELNYQPHYTLATGLQQTVAWAKQAGWL